MYDRISCYKYYASFIAMHRRSRLLATTEYFEIKELRTSSENKVQLTQAPYKYSKSHACVCVNVKTGP